MVTAGYNTIMLLSLLFQNPILFLLVAIALVISISLHEFAHAYMADRLGDSTARDMGRVTLNPLAHLDPLGTVLLLVAGFGWGKPVPFNPMYLKNPKRDAALISVAGPLSNFLLASGAAILFRLSSGAPLFSSFFYFVVFFNLILGFFNLIPLHPLDGFKVVYGLLSDDLAMQWGQIAPYGIYILLLLVVTRSLSMVLNPLVFWALGVLGVG